MISNNKEAFLVAHDLLLTAPSKEDFDNVKGLLLHLTHNMTGEEIQKCVEFLINDIDH
jgi:hypothetical protein